MSPQASNTTSTLSLRDVMAAQASMQPGVQQRLTRPHLTRLVRMRQAPCTHRSRTFVAELRSTCTAHVRTKRRRQQFTVLAGRTTLRA